MPLTASINCGCGRRFCTFRAPSLLLAGGSAAWRRMPPSPSARRRAGGRRVADFEMPHKCKEKGSKGSAIAHDPRMALGTCELGQRSAMPCRAVLPAHFQHSHSGVGLCSGEVPCRTGVRAASSLCSCFLVSAGLSVCVHCFFLFVVSIWHGCVKKQEIAAYELRC